VVHWFCFLFFVVAARMPGEHLPVAVFLMGYGGFLGGEMGVT